MPKRRILMIDARMVNYRETPESAENLALLLELCRPLVRDKRVLTQTEIIRQALAYAADYRRKFAGWFRDGEPDPDK